MTPQIECLGGVYWNQPVCPSVYPSVCHVSMCLSVYKILLSVKELAGVSLVTFSDSSASVFPVGLVTNAGSDDVLSSFCTILCTSVQREITLTGTDKYCRKA